MHDSDCSHYYFIFIWKHINSATHTPGVHTVLELFNPEKFGNAAGASWPGLVGHDLAIADSSGLYHMTPPHSPPPRTKQAALPSATSVDRNADDQLQVLQTLLSDFFESNVCIFQ